MSFLQTTRARITDVDALEAACQPLGLVFMRDQKTFKAHEGVNTCAHAIRSADYVRGDHEIGVVANADGSYDLAHDWYASGQKLVKAAGQNLVDLRQEYSIQQKLSRYESSLKREGWAYAGRKTLEDGRVVATLVKRT